MQNDEKNQNLGNDEVLNWKNEDNLKNFYQNKTALELLKGFSERGGLASGCDIELIFDDIKGADRLLEVGAGFGRATRHLIDRDFSGELHCLEPSELFCNEFSDLKDKLTLHRVNIMNFKSDTPFNAIIGMWSVISDFAPNEQTDFLKKLKSLITDDGLIILESFTWDEKPINAHDKKPTQHYTIGLEDCVTHGYIPSEEEIKTHAKDAGLKLEKIIRYKTTTDRPRVLFYLLPM